MRNAILLGLIVISGVGGLLQARPQPQRPDSLLVAPFATHISYLAANGKDRLADQLSYQVEESYPATDTLAFICDSLQQKGWKPLEYDFWNPTIPSSHSRGWTNFVDASHEPEQRVYQWMAQWKNEKHEIVNYVLRYRVPAAKNAHSMPHAEMNNLQVIAIFMMQKTAAQSKATQATKAQ
jgi:hypothetical protein